MRTSLGRWAAADASSKTPVEQAVRVASALACVCKQPELIYGAGASHATGREKEEASHAPNRCSKVILQMEITSARRRRGKFSAMVP